MIRDAILDHGAAIIASVSDGSVAASDSKEKKSSSTTRKRKQPSSSTSTSTSTASISPSKKTRLSVGTTDLIDVGDMTMYLENAGSFWAVGSDPSDPTTIRTQTGKVGMKGRKNKKSFASKQKADAYVDKTLAAKRRAGFHKPGAEQHPDEAALQAALETTGAFIKDNVIRLEADGARGRKFFTISQNGKTCTMNFGTVDDPSASYTKLKTFTTEDEAFAFRELEIDAKKQKGYQ
jgi:predicted DNA-binding WGR domain protein